LRCPPLLRPWPATNFQSQRPSIFNVHVNSIQGGLLRNTGHRDQEVSIAGAEGNHAVLRALWRGSVLRRFSPHNRKDRVKSGDVDVPVSLIHLERPQLGVRALPLLGLFSMAPLVGT